MERHLQKDRLKLVMGQSKLTQKELAQKSGVSQSNISYILSGKRPQASLSVANRLATALGVSVDWLSGAGDTEQPISQALLKVYDWDQATQTFRQSDKEPELYSDSLLPKLEGVGSISDCIVYEVQHENMQPLIYKGDRVTINLADTLPSRHERPRVYAVSALNSFGIFKIILNLNQLKLE